MTQVRVTAVDVGAVSVKALTCKVGKRGVVLQRFAVLPVDDPQDGWAPLMRRLRLPLRGAVTGLAGGDMTLRYTEVPPAPDWQLRSLMELEIEDMATQAGTALSADYNILPLAGDEEDGNETVLVAFAKDDALGGMSSEVEAAGGTVGAHIPNCIALYNAYLRCGPVSEDQVLCLVNLGHRTTDVAIVKGVDLLCVRSLSHGAAVFDEAIAKAFNVGDRKAGELKHELLDLDPQSRGRYASGQSEKVTLAAGGAGGVLVSGIQSSIAFCRTRARMPDLQIDRVLLCGGASRLRGIRGMLLEVLRCPVERFDPFEAVDLSGLVEEELDLLNRFRAEAVIALGLAVSKLDDSLYELEILPERIKRRRHFFERGIFNLAAVAVAVLLLVLVFRNERDYEQAAQSSYRRASSQFHRLEQVHEDAADLIGQNQRLSGLAQHFSRRARPLHSVLLASRSLVATLPEEGWIESLEVRATDRGRADRGLAVVLRGRIKDVLGGDIGAIYQTFLRRFRAFEHSGLRTEVRLIDSSQGVRETSFEWEVRFVELADGSAMEEG